ncbi:MAG: hypothetical protein MPW14_16915 [Candidatus Manganitrophus sp.]|nr:MAG: hypothetical protein MPW14_16915 [Candidatus Manganitrophus sp.]
MSKSGTPTMGGILILIAMVGSTLLWADLTNRYVWLVLIATVGFGAIGFMDDYLKCIRKNTKGLLPRYKFSLQILVALIIALGVYRSAAYSPILSVPFSRISPPIWGRSTFRSRSW